MNSEARARSRELAAFEAANWAVELRLGALGAAQREELVDWLRESPLNVAEFLRIARVSQTLDGFRGWDQLPDPPASESDNIIQWTRNLADSRGPDAHDPPEFPRSPDPSPGVDSPHNPGPPRHSFHARRRRAGWAVAVGGLVMAGAAFWLLDLTAGHTLRTAPGERREVTLADGSIVNLAPDSEIRVQFIESERDLRLLRGEAFFRVHKNAQRPFVVEVAGNRVRAVGTTFGVRRDQAGAVVTVLEGVVSVSARPMLPLFTASAPVAAPLLLGANQQVTIPDDGVPSRVKVVNSPVEVAWAAGELIFDDEPLAEVARRFNAHNRLQIVITDPALAARRVSGVFRTSDPESFVAFIQAAEGPPAAQQEGNRGQAAMVIRREGNRIFVGSAARKPADP